MAWTTPRTWVTDELVTAALMNSHIRDNFSAVPHLIARKTADQSVTSSTTLVDDTTLVAPVAANEVWLLKWVLRVAGISAADFKFGFTFPTGGEITVNFGLTQGGAALVVNSGSATSPFNSWSPDIGGGGLVGQVIDATYVNGSTAGSVVLQWAQATSSGTATTVKAQSTVWGCKLA